jgi:hypothetical protein
MEDNLFVRDIFVYLSSKNVQSMELVTIVAEPGIPHVSRLSPDKILSILKESDGSF